MSAKQLELWHFIAKRLRNDQPIMLLIVAESSGSSPGRAGYRMAVGADGELAGSIGGGVMEVNLVERSRRILDAATRRRGDAAKESAPSAAAGGAISHVIRQVHNEKSPDASGMICSGRQTVIFQTLTPDHIPTVDAVIRFCGEPDGAFLTISDSGFSVEPPEGRTQNGDFIFEQLSEFDFVYTERLGAMNQLYIVGGGHCALALSELMSKLDFHISIFDDRPDLNTIEKNRFADETKIIEGYEKIGEWISSGPKTYVVVMTLGYKSDETVIRRLLDKDFKYFGVLGSKAKMKSLLKALEKEGYAKERLTHIRTPIGLDINSRTPEEIAVSIAAEIIAVKNAAM